MRSFTADKAIDLVFGTGTLTESGTDGGDPWIKFKLQEVHCVREVIVYSSDGSIHHTWTWNGTDFSCAGYDCALYVLVEGEDTDNSDKPNCKLGNSVQLINKEGYGFGVNEVAIFAAGQYRYMHINMSIHIKN